MKRLLVGTTVLVLALAGCSSSSAGGVPPASAVAAPASTPSLAPSPPSSPESDLKVAAAAYLAMVTETNLGIDVLSAEFDAAGDDPVKLGAAYASAVAWGEDFIRRLDALALPASVQPQVMVLRAATDSQINIERRLAGTPSDAALLARVDDAYDAGSAAASDMRRVLGLPPVTAVATPQPAAPARPTRYVAGDKVTITENDSPTLEVTISKVKVVKSYPGDYYADKPQVAGNVFIQAFVSYRSLADGASYNSFDWQVFADDTAVEGFTFLLNGPEPGLGSGTLPKGRKATGWLVYEVPARGEILLSYGSQFSFTNAAPLFEITLRK